MRPKRQKAINWGLLLKVVHLSYQEELKNTEIARQLGITPVAVAKLLKEAEHYVEIKYNLPVQTDLATRLMGRYRLRHAVVVATGDATDVGEIVGHAAGRFFAERVRDGHTVSLSCGRTLLQMIQYLPRLPDLKIRVAQLSVEGDPNSIHQTPATLVGLLKGKVHRESVAMGVQLPPPGCIGSHETYREELAKCALVNDMRDIAAESDFVFIGVGLPLPGPNQKPGCFQNVAIEAVGRKELERKVEELNLVGEVNNYVFDQEGVDRTGSVRSLSENFINVLALDSIRGLAQDEKKTRYVVAVATGREKTEALRTVLLSGIANVAIVAQEDAEALLE